MSVSWFWRCVYELPVDQVVCYADCVWQRGLNQLKRDLTYANYGELLYEEFKQKKNSQVPTRCCLSRPCQLLLFGVASLPARLGGCFGMRITVNYNSQLQQSVRSS